VYSAVTKYRVKPRTDGRPLLQRRTGLLLGGAGRSGESIAAMGEFSSRPVCRNRRSVVGNYVQSAWVLLLVYGLNSDKEGNLTDVGASAIGCAINKESI